MRTRYLVLTIFAIGLLLSAPGSAQDSLPKLPPLLASAEGHTKRVSSGVFSPDAKVFFSASHDKSIRAWNVADGKEAFVLNEHLAAVNALGLVRNNRLVSAAEDGTIFLWDLSSRMKIDQLARQHSSVRCLAISHDQKILAVGGGAPNKASTGEI